jgi:aminoglycoside phosphotransferase (APT) family kinase protein
LTTPEAFKTELEQFLTAESGQPATITAARPLAGGASMETWALDVEVGAERLALILRRDMAQNMYQGALSRAQEFQLLRAAHEAGVLAPRPRWLHGGGARAFFLMDRLPGESVGRRVVRLPALAGARQRLAGEMGMQLARIHAIPLTPELAFLARPPTDETPAAAALAVIRQTIQDLAIDNPAWEWGLHWLTRHAPPPSGPLTLLHGDFRIGNLLVSSEGLSGVLDWEFAHIGDPLEDLAWPLVRDWRFGQDQQHVGGVGQLDDYLAAYEAAGGRQVERRALRWWEIVGNLRWAVFCHAQARRHLSGQDRSVEYASLGRKAAEMEWELLNLIERVEGGQ